MVKLVRNVLTSAQIEHIMVLYRKLPNEVDVNGNLLERHNPTSIGNFMLSSITAEELGDDILLSINKEIPNIKIIDPRILKYKAGGFINSHRDGPPKDFEFTDTSVTIQLCEPTQYTGGELIIEGKLFSLLPGDAVVYHYDTLHEVKKIKSGTRYVMNIRGKDINK